MRRGPVVLLLLTLLIAAAYGAQRAIVLGWQRIHAFAPAHFGAPTPSTGPPALASRLVLVVLDGLGPEDAARLPSLEWLRRKGSVSALSVPAPGFGAPALATLLSGAQPIHHGVLPGPIQPLQADSLPAAVARVRISSGGVGAPLLRSVLGSMPGSWRSAEGAEEAVAAAAPLLTRNGPRLTVIFLDDLRAAARRTGRPEATDPEYRAALATVDTQLIGLLSSIDLKTTAVMVTGLTPTGRNGRYDPGAPVPLLMAGAGVKPGVRGTGSLLDVAPTASALLGAPMPLQNSGRPLAEALQVEGRPADVLAQRMMSARKAFADASLRALGYLEFAPEPPATALESEAYLQGLEQQLFAARFQFWKTTILQRLPYLGGLLLLLLVYLAIALRGPFGAALALGISVYVGAFHAIFYLSGGRYSAAMAGLEGMGPTLSAGLGLRSAAAMCLASVAAGYALSRKEFKRQSYLTAAALHLALCVAAVVSLPILGALAVTGWEFPAALPSPGLLVWFFIAAIQVAVIGYLSLVWAGVTIATVRFSRHLWPLKEVGNPERNADKVVRMRSLRRAGPKKREG